MIGSVPQYVRLGTPRRPYAEGDQVRLTFADFGSVELRIVRVFAPGYYEVRVVGSVADRWSVFWTRLRRWLGI